MRKFKKALAFALASAMIVSVVPVSAAASNTAKAGKKVIYTYTVNNGATKDAKQTWIKTTTKKGYKVKLVNKTKKVVTLTGKKVVAKKAGTAKINVNFYKGKKYVATKAVKITVKKAPTASGIKLEKDTLNVGETTKVVHSGTAKVNCFSADTSIVKVNKTTGEVTAVAPGTTKIAVRNAVTKKRVYVDITVNAEFAAKQTGAKQITVTGADFTAETKVTIKKGTQTINLAKDGMTVTESGSKMILTTAAKLLDGDYVVTAGDKELTVKAQAEKVDKITVDSDMAILATTTDNTGKVVTDYHKAYAYYTVSNQFGEDITKNTTVTAQGSFVATGSAIDSNNKKVYFERKSTDDGFRLGDTVTVVVMYNENGQVVSSETKALKISDKAVVDTIEVEGLYNIDGKELTEDTLKKEDFYILFTAKDQYGNAYTNLSAGSNADSDVIATLAAGVTDVTLEDRANDTSYTIKTIKKDGKEYFGLKLYDKDSRDGRKNKAGQVLLTLIGSGSGKNVSYQFDVKDGIKVKELTISTDGKVLAANDKAATELSFIANDTYGNPITSYKELKDLFNSQDIKASQGHIYLVEDYKTGNGKLMYQPDTTTNGRGYTEVITGITETYGTVISQFTVQDKAYPKSITSSPEVNALLVQSEADSDYNKLKVKESDLGIQDQYGRSYAVYGTGYSDADGNTYAITVEEKTTREEGTFTFVNATKDDDTGIESYILSDGVITRDAIIQLDSGCEEGSKTYRAVIQRTAVGGTVSKVDTYDFDFYAVEDTKIRSYEMKKVKDLYYQAIATNNYAQEVVVYGKASGGVKVLMPHYYYGVTTTNSKIDVASSTYVCAGDTNADRKLPTAATGTAIYVGTEALAGNGGILDKVSSVDVTVKATVTSGAAVGTVLTNTIKLSKEKPVVQTDSVAIVTAQGTNFKTTSAKDAITIKSNTDIDVKELLAAISVKDQYGKTTTGSNAGIVYAATSALREYNNAEHKGYEDVKEQPKLTIFGIDETGVTINVNVKNNGTFDTIVNAKAGETFKLLITFANGTEAIVPITTVDTIQ